VRTLQGKIFAVVAGLVIAVGGVALYLQMRLYARYELVSTEMLNVPLAQTIAQEIAKDFKADRHVPESVKPTFSRFMAINPNIEIYLLNSKGDIVALTASRHDIVRSKVDLGPIKTFIANDFVFPILGDNPKDLSEKKIFSAAPLNLGHDDGSYIYVILGRTEFDAAARRTQEGLLLQSAVMLILFGIAAGLIKMVYVRRNIVSRLDRLMASITSFQARLSPDSPAPRSDSIGSGDEIDVLSRAFAEMAAHIEMLVDTIAENDRSRRELITNISHDLRTPIASVRGHLETVSMMNETLSTAARMKHLDIAIKQTARLERLIEELFELGKLDTPNPRISMEEFPIAELVQDVIQKFQVQADAKGIVLGSLLCSDMPRIRGDIALVERMLDNLLENAIRHTPTAGFIRVGIGSEEDTVAIKVVDSGPGIPAEHVAHVFDRFYKVDGGEDQEQGGAGLGLAIVKRIVQLHGGSIKVESRPGQGAAFKVILPMSR
jgi:two-component system OmpR family sensor kinase